jgi:hypothetical protein
MIKNRHTNRNHPFILPEMKLVNIGNIYITLQSMEPLHAIENTNKIVLKEVR